MDEQASLLSRFGHHVLDLLSKLGKRNFIPLQHMFAVCPKYVTEIFEVLKPLPLVFGRSVGCLSLRTECV